MTLKRRRRRQRRGGFTLIELGFVLTLLALIALLSSQLANSTFTLTREAGQAENAIGQFDALVGRLRRDVWQARQIEVSGPQEAVLRLPDGQTITWTSRDQVTTRLAAGKERQGQAWAGLRFGLTFEARGGVLAIRVPGGLMHGPGEVLLFSQVRLAEGGQR